MSAPLHLNSVLVRVQRINIVSTPSAQSPFATKRFHYNAKTATSRHCPRGPTHTRYKHSTKGMAIVPGAGAAQEMIQLCLLALLAYSFLCVWTWAGQDWRRLLAEQMTSGILLCMRTSWKTCVTLTPSRAEHST